MDTQFQERFTRLWARFVPGAELPLAFFYTDTAGDSAVPPVVAGHHCMIADLGRVRNGQPLRWDAGSFSCFGGKQYCGFTRERMPDFDHFLSCGIPGRMEGERYKKTPELVRQFMQHRHHLPAPARYLVFKRWDKLSAADEPLVAIFFARPDVLAALFTLANFDEEGPHGVIAPFGAGCGTIVHLPLLELQSEHPRAVLGMFDVSARPCVPADVLSFAVPWPKFQRMVDDMEESFLITPSWDKVRKRLP